HQANAVYTPTWLHAHHQQSKMILAAQSKTTPPLSSPPNPHRAPSEDQATGNSYDPAFLMLTSVDTDNLKRVNQAQPVRGELLPALRMRINRISGTHMNQRRLTLIQIDGLECVVLHAVTADCQ